VSAGAGAVLMLHYASHELGQTYHALHGADVAPFLAAHGITPHIR